MGPRRVLYVELKGEGARDTLRAFLSGLASRPGFAGGELLLSPAQPGLALVQSRWTDAPPTIEAPEGARAWMFEVVASEESR